MVKLDLDAFMYGLMNRGQKVGSNEQILSGDLYEGGRNAIREYVSVVHFY